MSRREIWVSRPGNPAAIRDEAAAFDEQGWHGIALSDSQNRSGDCIIAMTLAVLATQRMKVMPGVINPVTRHPVVLAAAAANLQDLSGGRMVMAVGRGDSSLAYLGMAPMAVSRFEQSVHQLSRLLRGGSIGLEEAAAFGGAPPVERVGYAHVPPASQIEWMTPGQTIPLEVVCSGPRSIAVGARHADRISFALGADTTRLRWAMDLAREEAAKAGRDPAELSFGCYVQAICHPDTKHALELGRGIVATLARFMSFGPTATVPVAERDRHVIESVTETYDMTKHGEAGSQVSVVDDDFALRLSILGPPDHCAERFAELFDIGLDRIIVITVNSGDDAEQRASIDRLASEVLPRFAPAPA